MRSQRVIKNFFMNETTRSGGSPPRLPPSLLLACGSATLSLSLSLSLSFFLSLSLPRSVCHTSPLLGPVRTPSSTTSSSSSSASCSLSFHLFVSLVPYIPFSLLFPRSETHVLVSALVRVKRCTLLWCSGVLRLRPHQPIRSPRGKRYYCCTTRNKW